MSTSTRVVIAFILLMIVWPAGFTSISVASTEFSPFEMTALRLTIAAVVMLVYAFASRMKPPRWKDVPLLFVTGAFGLAGYNLGLALAADTISPADASLVVALTPICVVVLSTFFLGEKIGWRTGIGILLGFSGAAIISLSKGGGVTFEIGVLFAFLSTTAQTTLTILQKKLLARYTAMEITIYSTVAGSLFALPFGYRGFPHFISMPVHNDAFWAILIIALSSSVLGYFLWAYLLTKLPASKTSSFLYFNPVMVVFISWLWIHTVPDWTTILGGVVTMCGVAIVNVRRIRKHKDPALPLDPVD